MTKLELQENDAPVMEVAKVLNTATNEKYTIYVNAETMEPIIDLGNGNTVGFEWFELISLAQDALTKHEKEGVIT